VPLVVIRSFVEQLEEENRRELADPGLHGNNNNNITCDNIYDAVMTWLRAIARAPDSFDECRLSAGWPPIFRPSQLTWVVSPPKIGDMAPLLLVLSP